MHSPARCPATTASPPIRAPFVVMARGRRSSSSAPEAEQQDEALARILRTEAAVSGVSRKAAAGQQSTRLWPRAVLEALDSAVASCRWESALEIFDLLRKQRWYEPKSQTYARLLMMLGRCRQPGPATALFKTMLSEEWLPPTVDVYTALVSAYGHSGLIDEALATVDRMKGATPGCKPDEYTFSVLINCCCKSRRFDLIPVVLHEMEYLGLGCNVVIHNGIIDGYGKAGMLEEMENALSNMLEGGDIAADIYTMNSIVWAYGNRGRVEDMEKWYSEFQLMLQLMKDKKCKPGKVIYTTMIQAYIAHGLDEAAMLLETEMERFD